MAWQNPKTDWKAGDVPAAPDFNRIEGNVQELQNTKETSAGAQAKANAAETNAKNHASGLVGSLANLLTTAKSNLVAAINEIFGKVEDVEDDLDAHLADYVPFKDRTNMNIDRTNMNILNLAIETEVLKGAVLTGITANIYIETFQDATDVDILQGYLIPGDGITG